MMPKEKKQKRDLTAVVEYGEAKLANWMGCIPKREVCSIVTYNLVRGLRCWAAVPGGGIMT